MTLRIVSWNIRKAVGLDWRRDPDRVLAVLEDIAPDIVLLQEADRRLPPRPPALPIDAVREAGWVTIDADLETPSIGHHGNAVLMHPDFTLHDVVPLDLKGLEPRGAVLAHVQGRGYSLALGAMHLGLRRADRLVQMRQIIEAAEALDGDVLLGGDTNEWRSAADAFDLPLGWQLITPGRSFHAARPTLSLDRFVLGAGLEATSHGVWPQARANRASDHLPVWVDIRPHI